MLYKNFQASRKSTNLNHLFKTIASCSFAVIITMFSSCLTPPGEGDGTIDGDTYTNSTIGLRISAPTGWTITKDGMIDPEKVLVIKYMTGGNFNPNVIVSASPNAGNDSLLTITNASISQFVKDTTYSGTSVGYSVSTQINGQTYGEVQANVTYKIPGSTQTLPLTIIQYVTIHKGYVIAITFMDTPTDLKTYSDPIFSSIRESIELFQ